MRIIGGKFKGKKLNLPNKEITRPLRDIVKESIFNLIIHSKKIKMEIDNSKILDLFAGSGSFGIECFSRGADKIFFCENNIETINILKKNLSMFIDNDSFNIIYKDCFELLNSEKKFSSKFDIIFVDPPYKELRLKKIILDIYEKNILEEQGVIIIHRHYKEKLEIPDQLKIVEDRKYGLSRIIICKI